MYDILIIPKYALLFGPRWLLLLVVLFLFLLFRHLSKRQLQLSVLLILLSLNYLDFQIPKLNSFFSSSYKDKISILSANVGGGGGSQDIDSNLFTKSTDIVLLQEARRINMTTSFVKYKYKECISGLCIFSKYPFKQVKKINRKLFGGWGSFAIFYQIHTEYGEISLANVHFETPRTVLMGFIYRSLDFELAKNIESKRQLEAELVSLWSKSKAHTLIVGDFNMPADENIYQNNFSELNNAVDVKSFSFSATKHTSWHGVRIDHILYSDDFKLLKVEIIDSIPGDHRPVYATFSMSH